MEDIFDEQSNGDESFDFKKYTDAIKRRWWLIVAIFILVTVPWIIYLKRQPPVFESKVWIAFEMVSGQESDNLVQSRIIRLKSRSFAEKVTADLGLTLELIKDPDEWSLSRFDFFDSFSTNRNPQMGNYRLTYYPTGYCALYHESLRMDSLRFKQMVDTTVVYSGMTFSLKPDAFKNRDNIYFKINNFRTTVSSLQAREVVNFNRKGDVMSIALKAKNPIIASETVNKLAEIFISYSEEMSRDKVQERLNYLKTKLNIAKEDLSDVEARMKAFNYNHPMGLSDETMTAMRALKALELDSTEINLQKNALVQFIGKFELTGSGRMKAVELGHYIYRQIASMTVFDNDPEMKMARLQLHDYDTKKKELQRERLSDSHQDVIELSENISRVEMNVVDLAKRKLKDLDQVLSGHRKQMNKKQQVLSSLPAEQVRLMSLERQQASKQLIYNTILSQVDEAGLAVAVDAGDANIIDKAVPIPFPVSGNKRNKAAAGCAAGLALGFMVVLGMEMVDKRIKTRNDIKRYLKLPMLGVIPKVKFDDYELQDSEKAKSISSQIVTHDYSPTPVGEAYRSLRTSLLFNKSIGKIQTIAIGSAAPGEGKSFTAANLGITLAQQKSNTLLVDADLRRGVLHNSFNVSKKPGLTNFLTGVVPLEAILHETYIPNLTLITCGSLLPNPSELLGSDRMTRFIEGVKQRFDFIIFDTPPLMAASDAVILSTLVDGVVVLVRSGMTNRNQIAQKLELFNNLQTNVLGALLNCAGAEVAHDGYSYYRY